MIFFSFFFLQPQIVIKIYETPGLVLTPEWLLNNLQYASGQVLIGYNKEAKNVSVKLSLRIFCSSFCDNWTENVVR